MTILITGSTGKTSRNVVRLLQDSQTLLIASRSGTKTIGNVPGVNFDWNDTSTHENPFNHPQVKANPITAVYLVAPERTLDIFAPMKAFMDTAKARGVRRMVLLTTSNIDADTPVFLGYVHKYLKELGLEWGVVRPNWFDENFSEMGHMKSIRDDSAIYTAAGDGKAPFISVEDIAEVAVRMLVDEPAHNTDHVLLGPALHDYDELAQMFTTALGREIRHVKLSPEGKKGVLMKEGFPEGYAGWLAELDTIMARGDFAETNDTVEKVTGKKPLTFEAFIAKHHEVWVT